METQRKRKGQTVTPEQHVWYDMIARCYRPNHPRYKDYGAMGVKVCKDWRDTTEGGREAFTSYMGPRPEGHVLGRLDTTKGYGPGNVAWMTRSEARRRQSNAVRIKTPNGPMALADLAEQAGRDPRLVRRRVQMHGWSPKEAVEKDWADYRRLTPEQAKEIYAARLRGVPCRVLAEKYGVSENLCSAIGRGLKWASVTGAAKQES